MKYKKITTGFVIQDYEDGQCTGQEFIAGDQVDRENAHGESVEIDKEKEKYQPFDMIHPVIVFYFIYIWSCVSPVLYGPYDTEGDRENALEALAKEEGRNLWDEGAIVKMEAPKGSKIELQN